MIDNTKMEQDYQCIQYLTNVTNLRFTYQLSLVWESGLGVSSLIAIYISQCAMGFVLNFCSASPSQLTVALHIWQRAWPFSAIVHATETYVFQPQGSEINCG